MTAALVLVCALSACGDSHDTSAPAQAACPRSAAKDASYSSSFVEPVSMGTKAHVIRVTRAGRRVSAARICVHAAMPAMKGMDYAATGKQLAPGRFRVAGKFAMNGDYRGTVIVRQAGREVAIALAFSVGSHAQTRAAGGMGEGTMAAMSPLAPGADGRHASAGGLTLKLVRSGSSPGKATRWTLRVVDSHGTVVTRFEREQTKLMHLIVVRDDFTGYQHLHPVLRSDGRLTLPVTLPAPGRYRAIADFTTKGTRYALGVNVSATGRASPAALAPPRAIAATDGYTVKLTHGKLSSSAAAPLTFAVLRAGRPVAGLQPYLGSFGHLVALRKPDLAYSHVHPIRYDARAGRITFHAEFPSAATYRLFLQFRAAGAVHTAPFTVTVGR